jgi:hypothetical protein
MICGESVAGADRPSGVADSPTLLAKAFPSLLAVLSFPLSQPSKLVAGIICATSPVLILAAAPSEAAFILRGHFALPVFLSQRGVTAKGACGSIGSVKRQDGNGAMKKSVILALVLFTAFLSLVASRKWRQVPAPLLWQTKVPWLSSSQLAAANDGTVFALTYADDLIAVDPHGKVRWTYSAPSTSPSPAMVRRR